MLQPAPWLDQPARLFAKAPPPAAKKVAKAKKKKPPPQPMEPRAVSRMAAATEEFADEIEQAYKRGVTVEGAGPELN